MKLFLVPDDIKSGMADAIHEMSMEEQMVLPTMKTDALKWLCHDCGHDDRPGGPRDTVVVPAEEMAKLERELATLKDKVNGACVWLQGGSDVEAAAEKLFRTNLANQQAFIRLSDEFQELQKKYNFSEQLLSTHKLITPSLFEEWQADQKILDWLEEQKCYCGIMTRFLRADVKAAMKLTQNENTN